MALKAAACFIVALAAAFAAAFATDTGVISVQKSTTELIMWALASGNSGLLSAIALLHHRLQALRELTRKRITLMAAAAPAILALSGILGHLAARF